MIQGLQEEANLKPSDSALRSSTNEPRWFHRDLGLSRIYKKVSIAQLKTRGRALRISKWCRTRRTNFIGAHADKMPLCSSFQYGGLHSLPIDTLLRKRSTESVPSVPSVWECCAKLICIRLFLWFLTTEWFKGLQEEANLKPSDSALRYFINEPHKFHRDRGLLRIWRRNITEIELRSKRFCHISRRSRSHLPNNHAEQLQAYSDHSASWWTDITTKRTRGTASWFPMSIEISF